jgi:hypothetical protein
LDVIAEWKIPVNVFSRPSMAFDSRGVGAVALLYSTSYPRKLASSRSPQATAVGMNSAAPLVSLRGDIMFKFFKALAWAALLMACQMAPGQAQTILVTGNGHVFVGTNYPANPGQSFTAPASHLREFGFFVGLMDEAFPPVEYDMVLVEGAGPGGKELGRATMRIPDFALIWTISNAFGDIELTPGKQYTMLMDATLFTITYGLTNSATDYYPGGTAWFGNRAESDDCWFYASFVPEPASYAMLATGMLVLACLKRKKPRPDHRTGFFL